MAAEMSVHEGVIRPSLVAEPEGVPRPTGG